MNLSDLLRKHHLKLNRDLGQHFLHDDGLLDKIARSADITKNDLVVEIGTGAGTLTKHIAKFAGKVITIEVDKRLIPVAQEYLHEYKNIDIVNDDALKMDLKALVEKYPQYKSRKVVANLPYYITSPLITKLIEKDKIFNTIVVTIQKEVAERIAADPGGKEYGSFSIFVNYYAKPKYIQTIPSGAFLPAPKVQSAILRLDILEKPPVAVKDEKMFFKLVHAGFVQRRKMLKNSIMNANLAGITAENLDAALSACKIDGKRRGETLSIKEFAELSDKLST